MLILGPKVCRYNFGLFGAQGRAQGPSKLWIKVDSALFGVGGRMAGGIGGLYEFWPGPTLMEVCC